MIHRADKDCVPPLTTIAIAVVAVVASTLPALALLATLILSALVLIAVIASPTPRFPIGRVLRLIECIVHLFTCWLMVACERFLRWKPSYLGKPLKCSLGWMKPAEIFST
jgi:hypothetical protein